MSDEKIGILDPKGINLNPLNNKSYSDTYRKLALKWSEYPAYEKADTILETLNNYQLIFIISGTGSGKTVLLPKFALHYTNYKGLVGVTLPKRTVTLSAAEFAAQTLDVKLGNEIGYVYKGSPKNMLNDNNKIVYMTDGTLIMKFVADPFLTEYNVIIIDEAHERSIQIDLLMLFLKQILLSGKRPDLRVIIMSATIDTSKYVNYFTGIDSKVIEISGQPLYPIETIFLDRPTSSYMSEGLNVINELILSGVRDDMLFFITTSNEAVQLCRNIRTTWPKVYCIEVYADMDNKLKEFATSKTKYLELGNYDQKLIMATNVAESSLTIDGLSYVIDSCYELYGYFDPDAYGQVLEKRLITKAQALQRRGRVGRTSEGICYHLVTKTQFDNLRPYPEPNILKEDITIEILKVIQLSENKTLTDGLDMMSKLMDKPTKSYINAATDLYKLYDIIDSEGNLTKVGKIIIKFSSLNLSQVLFLIYGYELFCAREVSYIIGMIESLNKKLSNLFYKADTICDSECMKIASNDLKKKLVNIKSDHLTFLKIYQEFANASNQKVWANKYGIRLDRLNEAKRIADTIFYKLIGAMRMDKSKESDDIEQISDDLDEPNRVKNKAEMKKAILEALKKSHQHLVASRLKTVYPVKQVHGTINKESVVNMGFKRKELETKKFVYDELVMINDSWEFSVVTLI